MYDHSSTKRYIVQGLLLFVSITVLALLYPTARWFIDQQPFAAFTDPREINYGLNNVNDGTPLKTSTSGYIYLFGTPLVTDAELGDTDTAELTSIYAFDIKDERLRTVPATPDLDDFATDEPIYGALLAAAMEPDGGADDIHPAWIDYRTNEVTAYDTPSLWNEMDLVVPPKTAGDRQYFAYTGQVKKEEPNTAEWANLKSWQIVVHNPFNGDTRIIESASAPVWINDGADLVYLKEDGIYRYNIAADASERIDDSWDGLGRDASLAVAPDNSALIMAVPNLNSLAVYRFTDSLNGDLVQEGIIAQEGVMYFDPVFHPNSREYAVLASRNAQPDTSAEVLTIEHRSVLDRTLLNAWPVDFDTTKAAVQLDWRSTLEPYELR